MNSLFLLGKQTSHQQLIPEFKHIQTLQQIPMGDGFKVLLRQHNGGDTSVETLDVQHEDSDDLLGGSHGFETHNVTVQDDSLGNSSQHPFRVGWYHSHMEHVELARGL